VGKEKKEKKQKVVSGLWDLANQDSLIPNDERMVAIR